MNKGDVLVPPPEEQQEIEPLKLLLTKKDAEISRLKKEIEEFQESWNEQKDMKSELD